MSYKVNKGVGRSFEFKGLRTSYVFMALGGLVASVLLYFVCGLFLPSTLTILLVAVVSLGSIGGAYYLNAVYGEHGLSLERSNRRLPQRIQNDRRIYALLSKESEKDEF